MAALASAFSFREEGMKNRNSKYSSLDQKDMKRKKDRQNRVCAVHKSTHSYVIEKTREEENN